MLVSFLLALITVPLALAWTVGAFATVGGPVSALILERTLPAAQNNGLAELMGVPERFTLPVDMGLQFLVGVLFLLTLGPVVRGLTALHQSVARGLLSSRYREQQQLLRTEQSRAASTVPRSPPPCDASNAICTMDPSSAWCAPRWTSRAWRRSPRRIQRGRSRCCGRPASSWA